MAKQIKKPVLTHFICLPLRSPSFQAKVTAFNALLPNTIHESIIRPVTSLHFTLGVLSLPTPESVESVVSLLQSLREDVQSITNGRNLRIRLKGIASMQTNVSKARVVYAVPEIGDGTLDHLAGNISARQADGRFLTSEVYEDRIPTCGQGSRFRCYGAVTCP
jgi:activating signal cointegrator complex subunit 1